MWLYFFGIKASFAEVILGAGLKTLWISRTPCRDYVIVSTRKFSFLKLTARLVNAAEKGSNLLCPQQWDQTIFTTKLSKVISLVTRWSTLVKKLRSEPKDQSLGRLDFCTWRYEIPTLSVIDCKTQPTSVVSSLQLIITELLGSVDRVFCHIRSNARVITVFT